MIHIGEPVMGNLNIIIYFNATEIIHPNMFTTDDVMKALAEKFSSDSYSVISSFWFRHLNPRDAEYDMMLDAKKIGNMEIIDPGLGMQLIMNIKALYY